MDKSAMCGVARANITPSIGHDNMGDYLRLAPAKGIGNELYAKSLVFEDGERRVVIVTADIIGFPEALTVDIRRRIEKLTGITASNVLLSASHTHSSPAIDEKDHASREYLIELAKKIAGAVYMADQNKMEALIGSGVGEAKVSINRWQKIPTGVKWGPNPDAPVDHEVQVLRIDNLEKRPIAVLVNYACHPSIMGADNLLYSGDYTSYVQEVIERAYGGKVTALFSTGAGGDVKIALLTEDGKQFRYGDLSDCRRYGTIIGAEVIKVIEGIETARVERVMAKVKNVNLPLYKHPTIQEVEKERQQIKNRIAELEKQGRNSEEARLHLRWAEATLKGIREGSLLKSIPAEVQLIRVGDKIAFFAVPGELFVEIGLKIKKAMGLPGSFVVAYANGCIGYFPSKQAERDGWCDHDDSYRASLHPSNFSGDIEDVFVEAAKELLHETNALGKCSI